MMTLDEAIIHAQEQADRCMFDFTQAMDEGNNSKAMMFVSCAKEHKQLTGWLIELKELKDRIEPKRPNLEADGYWDGELVYDTWYCPQCDADFEVDGEQHAFCPLCGQAILWESDEDEY